MLIFKILNSADVKILVFLFPVLFALRSQKENPLPDCLKFSLRSLRLPLALSHPIGNSQVNNHVNFSYILSSQKLSFLVRFPAQHRPVSEAK